MHTDPAHAAIVAERRRWRKAALLTVTIKLSVPVTPTTGQVGAVDVCSDEITSRSHPVTFVVQ